MQTNTLAQLVLWVILVLSDGNCMPLQSNGLERYGPDPYYQKEEDIKVDVNYDEPDTSFFYSDEYYSMRGHDKRPGHFYVRGGVPLGTSKTNPYCSDTLHHYIENCFGVLQKLRQYKSIPNLFYDIKTHAEREIEYELLMQKFIEVLYKLVLLKAADEHVYDKDASPPPPVEPQYYPSHFYHAPSYPMIKHNEVDTGRYEIEEQGAKSLQQKPYEPYQDYMTNYLSPSAYRRALVDLVDVGYQPVQVEVKNEPMICFKLKKSSDDASVNTYLRKRCKGCTKKAKVESPKGPLYNEETTNLIDQRFGSYKAKRQEKQVIDLSDNENNKKRFAGKPVLDDTFTNSH